MGTIKSISQSQRDYMFASDSEELSDKRGWEDRIMADQNLEELTVLGNQRKKSTYPPT